MTSRTGVIKAQSGKRTSSPRKGAPSPELRLRLEQSNLLHDPRIIELWEHLSPAEQRAVMAPNSKVGHRYPLTSPEIARLTDLTERQVRYWADKGLVPCWHIGRRRQFEAAGLIVAYALSRASQHQLQFYRGLLEDPPALIAERLSLMRMVLASRIDSAKPKEAEELARSLVAFAREGE